MAHHGPVPEHGDPVVLSGSERPAADVIELTRRLVAIDSVNPSLVPGAAGEVEIARFVVDWATAAGLAVSVVEATPGRPSAVVRGGRAEGGRVLLLCGHLDTVAVDGMADPFADRVEGDRLYGRGAYDMKGGLAAALVACREAAAAGVAGEVLVAAVADEEHSSLGIQEVLQHVTADAAIVTEPTELTVARAHRGFVWIELEILGRAAHGSRPHLGVDAIIKTGPILVALHDLDVAFKAEPHPLLGPRVLHASLISGGIGESTIPDRCVLTVERRTLPGESTDDVAREIEDLLERCRRADPELRVSSRITLARDPFETPEASDIVGLVSSVAADTLGRPVDISGMSYWADSAFLSGAGIPTVLFGPDGDGAHAEVEWVGVAGTEATARILTEVALRFCR